MRRLVGSLRTPRHFFVYMLGFLLLTEWLMPLPAVSDTGFISLYVGATALFFMLTFFRIPWWALIPLMGIIIMYGLHLIFFPYTFMSGPWWQFFFSDIGANLSLIAGGEWFFLTEMFRSFLFFILMAIMSYLIYFWVIYVRRIFFFFVVTVTYIAVMDTFLPYDGTFSILRVFFIGFLLLAVLQWDRVTGEFPGRVKSGLWVKWTSLALVLLFVAGSVGIAAPKEKPQWEDPMPFLQNQSGVNPGGSGETVEGTQRIGYGDNDERLGGGFEMDESPVFRAWAERGHYWRGESKNVYTGHGWDADTPEKRVPQSMHYEEGISVEELDTTIEFAEGRSYGLLFYPGELRDVNVPGADVTPSVDRHTGQAEVHSEGSHLESSPYEVSYSYPQFPIERMRENASSDPDDIEHYYLQLPDELPERVADLAEELTSGHDNRYDKARAVESYLNSSEFTYETEDIAVPEEGQDYVDQFLFETQEGYCDNFSTSMAVLLRSVDIPTRWVKGFTRGEEVEYTAEGSLYEITNANAHSWVEVYFPDVGWVPFEPTRGFSSSFDYIFEETGFQDEDWEAEQTDPSEADVEEEQEEGAAEEEEEEEAGAASVEGSIPWWVFALLAVLALTAFMFRHSVMKQVTLLRYKKVETSEAASFMKAFESLLWLLGFNGMKRENGETLREFAGRVDEAYGTKEMSLLTSYYEKMYYGNKTTGPADWSSEKDVWAGLVKRIEP
ncbi:transglutaminase TgpA family protein [Bacillus sp. FJAT-44742]|uniref:transglutaminase TgpA family protein n=1 Tax=Bacillus sp. FJAT-44742 TaxID=2014005 RepID=UPI0012FF0AE2|nr:transglutaminaseTgpA domain-containing protein [Bacillus sp. FJAT-44742]